MSESPVNISSLLLITSIVLSAIIAVNKFFPEVLSYQRFPTRMKSLVTTWDNSLLKNYGIVYVLTFTMLIYFWASAIYWFYGWLSIMALPTKDNIIFSILAVLVLALSSYLITLFFSQHLNVKLLRRSKNNRKKYLPYVLRFFIHWGEQLYSLGALTFAFLTYWAIFLIVGWAPLKAYWNIISILTFSWMFIAIFCLIGGKILTIRVADRKVLMWLLNYLNETKKDPKNWSYRFMLPKVVDYSYDFASEDFPNLKEVDLTQKFEILYLAKVWGDSSEAQAASNILQSLISKVKDGLPRSFLEVLCTVESDQGLASLTKLKASSGMVFIKVRKKNKLGRLATILTIVGGIAGVITLILDYLSRTHLL